MRTYPFTSFRRWLLLSISALLIAQIFGCARTIRMISCESWTYQGTSENSPWHVYRIEMTTEECGSKCGCLTGEDAIRCKDGWESYCFRNCTHLWEVDCGKWVETTASFDFITGEEIPSKVKSEK